MNAKRMMMTMAAAAALVFAGCVPGTAKITAKASELDKAMDGGIGWVKVVEHQEKEFDNIALTNIDAQVLSKFCLQPTNRYEHVVSRIFEKGFDEWIPLFLQDDEKVTYGYAVTNGKVRVWLDAELVAPIGRNDALLKAQLPRLMQLKIDDNGDVRIWGDHEDDGAKAGREFKKFLGAPAAFFEGVGAGLGKKKLGFPEDNDPFDFFWSLGALCDFGQMEKKTFEMLPGDGHHKLVQKKDGDGISVVPVN